LSWIFNREKWLDADLRLLAVSEAGSSDEKDRKVLVASCNTFMANGDEAGWDY